MTAALKLAERGVPVFPCLENKRPACPNGFKEATSDLAVVQALFRRYPGPLVGVPTGPVSRFDVLDLDLDAGADDWLSENCTRLPISRKHHTRSGGYHILFRHHPGLRNSAGKLAPGVDVRADGGYVVWWPATGLPVSDPKTLAEWPSWVLEGLMPPPAPPRPAALPLRTGRGYVAAAVERACRCVAAAGEGTRNHKLNSETYSLARFIATGELSGLEVSSVMARAALDAGLDAREVERTIASALRARGAA